MYVVANRVYLTAGWEDRFEERFRRRAGQVEKQGGFVRMQILRPTEDKSPYVVLTCWQSEAAFRRWVGSEDFKLAHENPLPAEAFSAEGALECHEVVISAEAAC